MRSRILLNLLLLPKFRLSSQRFRSAAAREQGFSLAVVLIAMLSVVVAGVALANRTQTGRLASTVITSNREAREVADAGLTYVISEWNRPENRGMFTGLQPMTAWTTDNAALKNPCNDLTPTESATSDLAGKDVEIDANRRFRIAEVIFSNNTNTFSAKPGSNTIFNGTFVPNQVDLIIEGDYKLGNRVNTSRITKRLGLDVSTSCLPPAGGAEDPLSDLNLRDIFTFSYGSENPGTTPSLSKTPQAFSRNPNGTIATGNIANISCIPISSTATGQCSEVPLTASSGNQNNRPPININQPVLTQAQKDALNPPTFLSIATAAKNAGSINSIPAEIPSLEIENSTQITSDNPSCITFDGALHCRIAEISLSGGNRTLTVDTTSQPVFLYVEGDITTSGNANIRHVNCGANQTNNCQKDVRSGNNNSTSFTNFDEFQNAVFRFQIRGRAVGAGEQEFKFNGTPSANLLFWAPTASLELLGNADLASAFYVNKVSANGNTSISVISPPDSFNIGLGGGGGNGGGGGGGGGGGVSNTPFKTLTARSAIFTKFF
jgi:hypothetical protein